MSEYIMWVGIGFCILLLRIFFLSRDDYYGIEEKFTQLEQKYPQSDRTSDSDPFKGNIIASGILTIIILSAYGTAFMDYRSDDPNPRTVIFTLLVVPSFTFWATRKAVKAWCQIKHAFPSISFRDRELLLVRRSWHSVIFLIYINLLFLLLYLQEIL